jgi:hypothetical protein
LVSLASEAASSSLVGECAAHDRAQPPASLKRLRAEVLALREAHAQARQVVDTSESLLTKRPSYGA